MTILPNPPEVICVPQNILQFANPVTHDYWPCDLCNNWTPQEYCPIADEKVCGICHFAYPEDYHA